MSNLKIDRLQLEIIINNDQARKSLRALEDEARKLKKDLRKVPEGSDEWNRINKRLKSIQVQHDKIIEKLGLEKLTMRELTQRQRELNAVMRNMDPSVKEYKVLQKQLNAVKKRMSQLRGTTLRTNSSLSRMANGFNKYSMMIAGFAASITGIIFSFRKAIDVANDFNASVSNLSAMTGLTGKKLDWLSQKAKDLSGSVTENGIRITQTAKEIVDAYVLMGSARPDLLKNKEALAETTKQAMILATAQKMELNPAIEAVAASMNQFDLGANQTNRIINTLAAGSLKGSAFVQDLTDSLKNVGTVADASNMSLEQTVAMLEVLAKKQLKGEESGTQMRSALLRLKAAQLGYASGTFKLSDALNEMNEKLTHFDTQAKKDAYIMKVFGKRQITAGTIMLKNVGAYEKMTKAVTGTNIATEQAMKNTDNNKARLDAARARLNKITIELGEKLAPALTFSPSAFAHLMRMTLNVIKVFNKYKGVILTATAGIVAYTIATKIAANWDRIHYAFLVTKTAITKAYAFTTGVLTGKIRIATIAQKAWNASQKANVIGAIVGLLIAAGTALYFYTKKLTAAEIKQKELNDLNKKAFDNIAGQKVKMDILLKIAQDETNSKEKRIKAIKKLNELSPKYLGNLKLETINTNAAKTATDEYVASLMKVAREKAAEQKMIEIAKKKFDIEQKLLDSKKQLKKIEKTLNSSNDMTYKSNSDALIMNIKREKAIKKTIKSLQNESKILDLKNKALVDYIEQGGKANATATATAKATATATAKATATATNLGEAIKKVTEKIKALNTANLALAVTDEKGRQDIASQIAHLQSLLDKLQKLKNLTDELASQGGISKMATKGLKDIVLSDDDATSIETNAQKVNEAINLVLNNIQNHADENSDTDKGGAFWQAIGLGSDATMVQKLDAVRQMTMQAFSDINQIIANSEARQLQKYKKLHDKKKAILDKELNSGKISYEQYTARLSQLDTALDKKKRKLAHDSAVRQKALNLANAISGTALAIISAMKTLPFPADLIAAGIAGAMGALQIGVIASEPIPQLATGNLHEILGASDGRKYKAGIGTGQSGIYTQPTIIPGLGLVGEKAPELVFSGPDTQKVLNTPALLEAIKATLNMPQYATGTAREIIRENTVQTFTDPRLIELLEKVNAKLEEPAKAILVADEDYIRTHEQVKQDYDAFQKRVGM